MIRKTLFGLAALTLSAAGGCAVYVPGPAIVARPGLVIAPVPIVFGGYYPYHYGYYGYYGRGYYR